MNASNSYVESWADKRFSRANVIAKQSVDEGFDFGAPVIGEPDYTDQGFDYTDPVIGGAGVDATTGDLGSLPDPNTTIGVNDFQEFVDYENNNVSQQNFEENYGLSPSTGKSPTSTTSSGSGVLKGITDLLNGLGNGTKRIADVVTSVRKTSGDVLPPASGGNTPKSGQAGSGGGTTNTIDGLTKSAKAAVASAPSWFIPVAIVVVLLFVAKKFFK